MAKNLKLPNSYGSVTKMSNASRRRKPYMQLLDTQKQDKKVCKC